jgi:hypothetical protein
MGRRDYIIGWKSTWTLGQRDWINDFIDLILESFAPNPRYIAKRFTSLRPAANTGL